MKPGFFKLQYSSIYQSNSIFSYRTLSRPKEHPTKIVTGEEREMEEEGRQSNLCFRSLSNNRYNKAHAPVDFRLYMIQTPGSTLLVLVRASPLHAQSNKVFQVGGRQNWAYDRLAFPKSSCDRPTRDGGQTPARS